MKSKFNKYIYLGLGGLLQIGLLMSCTNDSQESSNISAVGDDITASVSSNLTALDTCSSERKTWREFGGVGDDYNVGVATKIDDRSCTYKYAQGKYGSIYNWGIYSLVSTDEVGKLQTRMERQSKIVNKVNNGNKIRFSGFCRIINVGTTDNSKKPDDPADRNGTYLFQVKGKDALLPNQAPVHCLFIAKAVRDASGKVIPVSATNSKPKSFAIYSERITKRDNVGSGDRVEHYITTVDNNKDFFVDATTGFAVTGTGATRKVRHYVNVIINEVKDEWNVPDNALPFETYFRMGAYRCHGGSATILWREGTKIDGFVNN